MKAIPRSVFWLLLLLAVCFDALLIARDSEQQIQFAQDSKISMRDGVALTANIWRPKADGRFPAILMRTPYGKSDEKWNEGRRYAQAGYVMVVEDCRGRGKSAGVWDPFRYDGEDGFYTQEWLGKQPWCNGEIGTAGGSYGGWATASNSPCCKSESATALTCCAIASAFATLLPAT